MTDDTTYSVIIDPSHNYIEVQLKGFLSAEGVLEFSKEFRAAKMRLSPDQSTHVTLIDLSDFKIQTQDVAANFAGLLSDRSIKSHKLAFYVGNSPVKMQLRRMMHDKAVIFEDMKEAKNWLFAPTES